MVWVHSEVGSELFTSARTPAVVWVWNDPKVLTCWRLVSQSMLLQEVVEPSGSEASWKELRPLRMRPGRDYLDPRSSSLSLCSQAEGKMASCVMDSCHDVLFQAPNNGLMEYRLKPPNCKRNWTLPHINSLSQVFCRSNGKLAKAVHVCFTTQLFHICLVVLDTSWNVHSELETLDIELVI